MNCTSPLAQTNGDFCCANIQLVNEEKMEKDSLTYLLSKYYWI